MKLISLLCVLSAAAPRTQALHLLKRDVIAFQTRPFGHTSNVQTSTKRIVLPNQSIFTKHVSAVHSLSLIRGGDIVPSILPPTTSVTLAVSTLLATYMLVTGAALFLEPVGYAKACWKEVVGDVTKADFDSALLQATGAIILGLSIHILLTLVLPLWNDTTSIVSTAHAMGYSLLPRIAVIAWSFLKGEGYQIDGSTFLKINFGMMSWTAFSLLAGVGNSNVSTKVFSTMALLKALALVANPVKMTQKIFSVDVSDQPKSRYLARIFGNFLATSAILMMALAYGLNPIQSVGVASLGLGFLLFDVVFVSKCWKWLEQDSCGGKQLLNLIGSFFVAAALLSYKS